MDPPSNQISKVNDSQGCSGAVLSILRIFNVLLTGCGACSGLSAGGGLGAGVILMLYLACCSIIALLFRHGWLIPSTVFGVIFGIGLPRGLDAQMIDTAGNLCLGTVLGTAIGFLMDSSQRAEIKLLKAAESETGATHLKGSP